MHTVQLETGKLLSLHPKTASDIHDTLTDLRYLIATNVIPDSEIKRLFDTPCFRGRGKRIREFIITFGWRAHSHVSEALNDGRLVHDCHWQEMFISLTTQLFVHIENMRMLIEEHGER